MSVDRARLRKALPFLGIALMFFLLSLSRPAQRGAWLAIGVVFLVVGLRRTKAAPPLGGVPGN